MDVDTQQHLTTLRNLLAYRTHELETELHAQAMRRAGGAGAPEASTASRELASCRAAQQRLDDGVYGDCQDCGDAIPLARLMAQPQAERCAHCQSAFDHAAHPAA